MSFKNYYAYHLLLCDIHTPTIFHWREVVKLKASICSSAINFPITTKNLHSKPKLTTTTKKSVVRKFKMRYNIFLLSTNYYASETMALLFNASFCGSESLENISFFFFNFFSRFNLLLYIHINYLKFCFHNSSFNSFVLHSNKSAFQHTKN